MTADLAHLGFHQVELSSSHSWRRHDRLATPHIAGEDSISVAEHARVVRQTAPQSGWAAPE